MEIITAQSPQRRQRWVLARIFLCIGAFTLILYTYQRSVIMAKHGGQSVSVVQVLLGESELQSHTGDRIKDIGASPVFSALSKLGRGGGKNGLPELIQLDFEPVTIRNNMTYVELQDSLVRILLQRQIVCTKWAMYGSKTDGGWPVCKALQIQPTRPCTVYSFGIRYDWSFDEAYRNAHGCLIRTFDPSMGNTKEHEHKPGIMFYPVGLSNKKGINRRHWKMETYRNLLKAFFEEKEIIPYLKFDIESYEWGVLENMMETDHLQNVVQLSFEVHVVHPNHAKRYFNVIKRLELMGFRRWFYHHRLNGFSFQCDQSYINMNFTNFKPRSP